jgi:hypothetical protein
MMRLLMFTPFLMVATMVLAPMLIRLGAISPLGGFGATMGAWIVGAGAGLLCGLIGVFKPDTRPLSWVALGLGVVLVGGLVMASSRASGPPIHDVTTDLVNPPTFSAAAAHPDNAGRDMTYPHGDPRTPDLQREHYPDLGNAVFCDTTREEVWRSVLDTANDYNWSVTWTNAEAGLIEAEATTAIFRFVDDIVIRLDQHNPPDGCYHIDIWSTSRVGRSDFGANARRISDFLAGDD